MVMIDRGQTGEISDDLLEIVLTIHALGEPNPTELCFALEESCKEDSLNRGLQNLRRLRELGFLEPPLLTEVPGQRRCYQLTDRGSALAAQFSFRAIDATTLRKRIQERKQRFIDKMAEDLRRRHIINSDEAIERIRNADLPARFVPDVEH